MSLPLDPADPRELGGYRLDGRLGEGGQGVVYLGEGADGTKVAVKVLKSDDGSAAGQKARERLAREMASAMRVAPFCTARVLASSVDGPRPYVVSEFVDGPSLQQRVESGGPLREGELDRLMVGTATALTAIHGAGVVHRDLKPANVLLGPGGPRVVDFGIARTEDSGTTTGLVGTPAYFAPEQLHGDQPSPASDVFSWAATMVYAATGRAPFGNDAIPAVLNRIAHQPPDLRGVPEHLLPLLSECLGKDPRPRPAARALLIRLVDPTAVPGLPDSLTDVAGQALNSPAIPYAAPMQPYAPTGPYPTPGTGPHSAPPQAYGTGPGGNPPYTAPPQAYGTDPHGNPQSQPYGTDPHGNPQYAAPQQAYGTDPRGNPQSQAYGTDPHGNPQYAAPQQAYGTDPRGNPQSQAYGTDPQGNPQYAAPQQAYGTDPRGNAQSQASGTDPRGDRTYAAGMPAAYGTAGMAGAQGTVEVRRRAGRGTFLLAGVAGTLAVVLVAVLVTWRLGGSGTPAASASRTPAAAATTRGGASTTPDDSAGRTAGSGKSSGGPATGSGPTLPADLAGTWSGTLKQTHNLLGDTITMPTTAELTAGSRTAVFHYQGSCSETWTLQQVNGDQYVFGDGTNDNATLCMSTGTLTLTKGGGGLTYHWGTGPSGEVTDGVLRKA